MSYPTNKLSEVFRDTLGHIKSSEIIISHSSNKEDIREFALRRLNLKSVKQVIDLGCGFGFFTRILKDKISRDAIITGIDCFEEYRSPFITVCGELGFEGRFFNSGIEALSNFKTDSADLILSSFSIYFFPEAIEQVAAILKKNGSFVVICHYSSHLRELTNLISEILKGKGYLLTSPLPHDKLINNFPAEEARERLSVYFSQIEDREYLNELKFTSQTTGQLIKYIMYKRSFFIPEDVGISVSLIIELEKKIREVLVKLEEFWITKNDGVFICTHPIKK
jgi:ubiquinone/menaquinone biosynthesis C-methylase UbiE